MKPATLSPGTYGLPLSANGQYFPPVNTFSKISKCQFFAGFMKVNVDLSLGCACAIHTDGRPIKDRAIAEEYGLATAGSRSEGNASSRLLKEQLWSLFCILHWRGGSKSNSVQEEKIMSMVLQLQKLVPAGNAGEMSVILMSTASGICPTTAVTDGDNEFQME